MYRVSLQRLLHRRTGEGNHRRGTSDVKILGVMNNEEESPRGNIEYIEVHGQE